MNRESKPSKYTPRVASQGVKGKFVTVAFDEKTRFILEVAARNERRTVSSLINEAVLNSMSKWSYVEWNLPSLISSIVEEVWSPFEASRFVQFADRLPALLNMKEQILWEIIQKNDELWRTMPNGEQVSRDGTVKNKINHDVLRERWDALNAKAERLYAEEAARNAPESAAKPRTVKGRV
jgi:hypothetical protein